ncbi:MAG: hypothetical protein V1899_06695 [Planctomycetota bacterium]
MKKGDELLREVIRYHEGKGKYNFSELSDEQRANAAFDAWMDLYNEIKIYLASTSKKRYNLRAGK